MAIWIQDLVRGIWIDIEKEKKMNEKLVLYPWNRAPQGERIMSHGSQYAETCDQKNNAERLVKLLYLRVPETTRKHLWELLNLINTGEKRLEEAYKRLSSPEFKTVGLHPDAIEAIRKHAPHLIKE